MIAVVVVGLLAFVLGWLASNKLGQAKIANAEVEAEKIIRDAEKTTETLKKEKLLEVKDEWIKLKQNFENETKSRRNELLNSEKQLASREINMDRKVDLLNKKADIRISYLTGSSKLSYTLDPRDYINLRALPKNVSSLLNITLNIHIAYAYIAKIPKSYMISYANQSSLRYVLTVRINNRTDVDKLSPIWIAFESPSIIIYRTFNTTKFYNGTILKVRLVIINYGDFNIPNVTITEARWWDNKSVVFLSGDTKLTVNMLPKKTSRSLEYIVLINTTKKLDIKIPPAEAIVSTPVNTTFICESNENILHLNRHAPFINASISDLPLKPAISRTLKYTIIVSNLGDKKASNVVYGDIIIPSLKPDEKRIYIRKVNISHISPWYIKVNESVSYIFENKSYSISLQSVRVILYPDNPRVPLLKVILEPKIINKSLLNLSLELTNIGGEVIKQAILKGFYNKTVFEYVKGPFELSKAGIMQLKLTSIEPDHAIRYSCIFKVISNKSSFYPYLEIISLNKHMVLNEISQLRLFYNRSISFTVCGLKRICILNETYSLNVSIFFDKSLNPHRINISYISKSKNVKIVESKTWNRSKYILTYTLKFKILETGNITLPTIRLTLLSGGESIDLRYDLGNVTTYFGIKLNIDFPNSVIEGSKVIMKYRIYTDVPGGINNVTIKLQIPPELQIRENESYIFIKYDRVTRTAEGIITLKAKKPGTYRILINYACFTLNSVNIRIEGVDSRICNGVLMIEVKENVITRYWSYFIPALIITLLMIFISKKYG